METERKMMQAFHGDTAAKSHLLDRLRVYAEAGAIINADNVWKDGKGSPVGCVVESTDLGLWPQRTGMPKALGCALDHVAKNLGSPRNAGLFVVEWIDAVPVGENMCGVAHELIGWLLTDPEHGVLRLASTETARQSVCRVAEMHRRGAAGQAPAAADWAEVRGAILAVPAPGDKDRTQQWVMAAAESAAWNPETAATVIADTLRAWSLLGAARRAVAKPADSAQLTRDTQPQIPLPKAPAPDGLTKPGIDMNKLRDAFFAEMMRLAQLEHQKVAKAMLDFTRRSAAPAMDAR